MFAIYKMIEAYLFHDDKNMTEECAVVIKAIVDSGMANNVVHMPVRSQLANAFVKDHPQLRGRIPKNKPTLVTVDYDNGAKLQTYQGRQILQWIRQLAAMKDSAPGQTMDVYPRPGPGMPVASDSHVQPAFQDALRQEEGYARVIDETDVYATNYGPYNNAFESPSAYVQTGGNKFLERRGRYPPSARPETLNDVRCPPWRRGNKGYPCYKDGQSLAVSDGSKVPLLAGPSNWKSHYFDNVTIGGIYTNFGPFTSPNPFDTDVYDRPFVTPWKRGNQEQNQRQYADAAAYRRAFLSF